MTKIRFGTANRGWVAGTALVLLLSGCQTLGLGGTPDVTEPTTVTSSASVDVARALSVFQDVCVATYPTFAEFGTAAAAAGLTQQLDNGGLGSSDSSLAAVVRQREGQADACFVNFFTTASGPDARGAFLEAFDGATQDGRGVVAPVEDGRIVASGGISNGTGNIFELRVRPGA